VDASPTDGPGLRAPPSERPATATASRPCPAASPPPPHCLGAVSLRLHPVPSAWAVARHAGSWRPGGNGSTARAGLLARMIAWRCLGALAVPARSGWRDFHVGLNLPSDAGRPTPVVTCSARCLGSGDVVGAVAPCAGLVFCKTVADWHVYGSRTRAIGASCPLSDRPRAAVQRPTATADIRGSVLAAIRPTDAPVYDRSNVAFRAPAP
jgi:hypothetical protein